MEEQHGDSVRIEMLRIETPHLYSSHLVVFLAISIGSALCTLTKLRV